MKSAPAIAFDYRPSRLLACAVGGMALLALAAIVFSGMPVPAKLVLAGAAVVYAAHALHRLLRATPRRVSWHAAGHWRIRDSEGDERLAQLESAAVRGVWIVLRLRRNDGVRVPLVLAPGNCDGDVRRRLRVRLARVQDDAATHADRRVAS